VSFNKVIKPLGRGMSHGFKSSISSQHIDIRINKNNVDLAGFSQQGEEAFTISLFLRD
jgi:hypothetical protein